MRILRMTLAVCMLSAGALAGDDGPLNHGGERHLGGHGFLPSTYVTDPWISTIFQNYTGGGAATNLTTPFVDTDGTTLFVLDGSVFFANLGLGFRQQLGERFAVGLRFDALIRTGTNAATLITEGANVNRSLNVNVKYRLVRTEASQFTLGLDWQYRKLFIITPYEFAAALIDGVPLEEATLLASVKNWTARITMEYAHAFSPTFGVRANGAVGLYEEPVDAGISKATHRLGVLAEADLQHRYGVPLGLTLGYTFGFPENDPGAGLTGTLLGFWYTGREAFVVGVETGYMKLPVLNQDKKIDTVFGIFTIRYYF